MVNYIDDICIFHVHLCSTFTQIDVIWRIEAETVLICVFRWGYQMIFSIQMVPVDVLKTITPSDLIRKHDHLQAIYLSAYDLTPFE